MLQKFCVISLIFLMTSCGFRPLYKVETLNGDVQEDLATIEFETKAGRQGQQLKNSLENAFNPLGVNLPKRYKLIINLNETHQAVAVQNNNEAKRYNVIVNVQYVFRFIDQEVNLYSGNFRMLGSYDAVSSSNFATLVGKQDTMQNVINEVSRELKRRIVTELPKK